MKIRINALELVEALIKGSEDITALAAKHGCTAAELQGALMRGSWKAVPAEGAGG